MIIGTLRRNPTTGRSHLKLLCGRFGGYIGGPLDDELWYLGACISLKTQRQNKTQGILTSFWLPLLLLS